MARYGKRRCPMCFEFEALYWAKVAEEEMKKKEAEKNGQSPVVAGEQQNKHQPREEPVTA
jgi:hypothetical protein